MIDVVRIQDDLCYALLGSLEVPVVKFRDMCLQEELDFRTLLTEPRNGRTGAGVMVAMPTATNTHPNVEGPVLAWKFPVVCLEFEALNRHAENGALISAEELAQKVAGVLHQMTDDDYGSLSVGGVETEKEYKPKGCRGVRVTLDLRVGKNIRTPICKQPACSYGTGTLTLTSATTGAQIYYTTDETFPGNDVAGNTSSQLYSAPVALTSGTVIRAAAYAAGYNLSAITKYTIP